MSKTSKVGIRFVISDPESHRTIQKEVEENSIRSLLGKKIGETFSGNIIDLPGYELKITGGSDDDGIPMRPDVHGGVRKRILLAGGVGFRPKRKGIRRKKPVRGNQITEDIVQINVKVTKHGSKNIFKVEEEKKE
ncbi:MAG: 30S ribosomal protein S6e [Candidatus Helarchaeota archaeon]